MPKRIAVVMPVLNDWESMAALINDIRRESALSDLDMVFVPVDDGSSEPYDPAVWEPEQIPQVHCVRLRANLGHQRAIAMGLAYVRENLAVDAVVVMDSDGEDRPADVVKLLQQHDQWPDHVIVAERTQRSESAMFKLFYVFYRMIFSTLTGLSIRFGNFSLVPATRLENILFSPNIWNHYAATLLRARVPIHFLPTERGTRYFGQSKMNFVSLLLHGLGAVAVYSEVVIGRLLIGIAALSVSTLTAIAVVVATRLFTDLLIPGYATTVVLFLGTLLTLSLMITFMIIMTLLSLRIFPTVVPVNVMTTYIRSVSSGGPDSQRRQS